MAHQLGIVGQRGDRAAGSRGQPRSTTRWSSGRAASSSAEQAPPRRSRSARVVTDLDGRCAGCDIVVEAVAEDPEVKRDIHRRLGELLPAGRRSSPRPPPRCRWPSWRRRAAAPTASRRCTSSTRSTKMKLVELSFPDEATAETKLELHRLCERLEKTAVEVPDARRLRRQPAALPLPVRRRAAARAQRHRARGDRHLHEARRRPPDGPAGAARLRRPRRRGGDRRVDRRRRARPRARADRRGQARPQGRRGLLQATADAAEPSLGRPAQPAARSQTTSASPMPCARASSATLSQGRLASGRSSQRASSSASSTAVTRRTGSHWVLTSAISASRCESLSLTHHIPAEPPPMTSTAAER